MLHDVEDLGGGSFFDASEFPLLDDEEDNRITPLAHLTVDPIPPR